MSFGFLGFVGKSGIALSNDAAPNSTAPPDQRVHEIKASLKGTGKVQIVALGGTTCTVQLWIKDAQTGQWWPLTNVLTVTPAIPAVYVCAPCDGAPTFLQLVANTGIEQLGYFYG